MNLIQRARDTGRCPPSLLSAERVVNDDGFETAVLELIEPAMPGMSLGTDEKTAAKYEEVLKMAEDVLKVPGELDLDQKRAAVEHRRCILLALLGCTSPNNPTLKALLSNGLLVTIKSWLDDILSGAIGGVDLLLHLLSSITDLPVTKSMVLSSEMGKAIRDIEKHKICAGTPNEGAIKTRVKAVKDGWNASVKVNKDPNRKNKRPPESSADQSPVKKKKVESTFSSLVKKASKTDDTSKAAGPSSTSTNGVTNSSKDSADKADSKENKPTDSKGPKKPAKRVKWADHFGGTLQFAQQISGEDVESSNVPGEKSNVSWSDRKKRDRLREKELLAKAKKAKIIDDDDVEDDSFGSAALDRMKPTTPWHLPKPLPERNDITKAQCASKQVIAQAERRARVAPTRYLSEEDVPNSPFPMTDVEEALDVASQASSITATIPFFVAHMTAPASALPPAPAAQSYSQPMVSSGLPPPPPPPMGAPAVVASGVGATAEMLQAMGLPLFLVGSNLQALQTLAQTPSLLSTFVDANGQYDQPRLMSLVQALTQNLPPSQQIPQTSYQQPAAATGMSYGVPQQMYQAPQTSTYGSSSFGTSHYGAASTTSTTTPYGAPPTTAYRTTSDAGNLHVSGYGPMTTQADLIALFTPYVRVDEVVMKPNFSFVNTSDPEGAARARETLNGTMLGGAPIRINPATRRNPASAPGYVYGGASASAVVSVAPVAPAPVTATGTVDYDSVRDDRGNPATKNLFVAGYGPGTTETQLRDLFSQHCTVTGCVMKGTFSFVNTAEKAMAVQVREQLSGSQFNGGILRINFAKETGRLGTSFDTTYGAPGAQSSRSPYMRPVH